MTYEGLAFHLDDSKAFRSFARLKMGQYPRDSTLQENISAIDAETWEAVNRMLLGFAAQQQVERGRTVRVDSTVVESTIHHPTDSTLLTDGIRVMAATPHLFKHKSVDLAAINEKRVILEHINVFRDRLAAEGIVLKILPGCDFPLSVEALSLLAEDRVLTVNDRKRYLLLELPNFSIPPSLEDICFRLQSPGAHPHHHSPQEAADHSGEAR